MSRWVAIAALILPGGFCALAAWLAARWLFGCRHAHEIWRRSRDGALGLECWRCHRWRALPALLPGRQPRLTAPSFPGGDPLPELERLARCARTGEEQ